nr:hypothetical protein [uncultured Flavobacterium sp.]
MKPYNTDWDWEEPNEGHEIRFLNKLNAEKATQKTKQAYIKYGSWVAIAILSFCLGAYYISNTAKTDSGLEPTIYYANQVQLQIEGLKQLETPSTRPIIADAVTEINRLEKDYAKLEIERSQKGLNEQLLNAMIINMQTRLDFLQSVQKQINLIQSLNSNNHEKNI